MSNTVSLSKKDYNYLKMRDDILSALEANGVENWKGFEQALSKKDYNYLKMVFFPEEEENMEDDV